MPVEDNKNKNDNSPQDTVTPVADKKDDKDDKSSDDTPKYPDDVQALLDKVRSDERRKVQSKLDELERTKENARLLREKAERLEEEAAQKKKEDDKKADKAKKSGNAESYSKEDVQVLLDTALEKVNTHWTEQISAVKAENERLALEAYKREVVAAAGDEIIPELIMGNTKEELDTAIIKAKAAYQQVAERVAGKKASEVPNAPPVAGGPGAAPTPAASKAERDFISDVRNMSMDEFRKQKNDLIAKAGSYTQANPVLTSG